ncbi:MAG TPA: sulfatase-like hydrolase/transferase, partial [Acidimicrobiia bacterium]|nr:sulfatase-like hydrolase/transferase [Acidimicrobiia bacterium]
VMFALIVALMTPLFAGGVLAGANAIGGRIADTAFWVMVGVFAVGAGFVISRQVLPDATLLAILVALLVGMFLFWLVRTIDVVFVFASLAVPVVLIMFLSTSASARLIWAEPEPRQAGVEVGRPSNIVMLQLDEMPLASIVEPDGTINEKLFPNFARLADTGTWYRNALSDSIATTQSVPDILTGVKGEDGQSPSYVDHPDNLFTLLDGSYEMHVIEWVANLCPEDVCPDYAGRAPSRFSHLLEDVGVVYGHLTLPGSLRESLPSIDNAWKGFLGQTEEGGSANVEIDDLPVPPGDERQDWVNWTQRIINGIDDNTPPTLSYAHLRAPHVPWVINPTGTQYERPEQYTEVAGVEGNGRWELDPASALLGFQRHLYQVGFFDVMLGRMLDRLEETGTWDDTMVIVVADHGASFVPGEHRRWPYENNRDDLYRVPLFIKYPDQSQGETVDLPAFGIDIVPTIVDALDIDTDWRFDGTSLLELDEVRPHEPMYWCCNGEGVSSDLGILFDQVERNYTWIPDQTTWLGVARVGSLGDMVGRPLTELEVTSSSAVRWSFDLGANLADVDRDEGIVQTLVTGRIETEVPLDGDELLIVVNDVVAGTAHLARDSASGGTFTGLVAEELIGDGANDVDVLAPSEDGIWLAGVSEDLTLQLVAGDGHTIEIGTEGSRRIQVDDVTETDSGWELVGWAADVSAKEVPDTIYVFSGEQLLYSGEPNVDNRNVVRWFDSEELMRSGFEIVVPDEDIPEDVDQLLVVAEFGDVAVADPANLAGD